MPDDDLAFDENGLAIAGVQPIHLPSVHASIGIDVD
jgi:hypothetical protein